MAKFRNSEFGFTRISIGNQRTLLDTWTSAVDTIAKTDTGDVEAN